MWWLARKPLAAGTVAANVLQFGTGALNIRTGCRVLVQTDGSRNRPPSHLREHHDLRPGRAGRAPPSLRDAIRQDLADGRPTSCSAHSAACEPIGLREVESSALRRRGPRPPTQGTRTALSQRRARWPSRLRVEQRADKSWACAADCPVGEMDRQSGVITSGANPERRRSDKFRDAYGEFAGQESCVPHRGADSGGASRFFPVFKYEPKAPAHERPRLPDRTAWPHGQAGYHLCPGLPA